MLPPRLMLRLFSKIHASVYIRSNGRRRNTMNNLPVLLLTSTGRKRGRKYTVPVVYLVEGNGFLIAPGVVPRPDWYLNLKHDPYAEIQIGAQTIPVKAEELSDLERTCLWDTIPEHWKAYERRAGITLPLIILQAIEPLERFEDEKKK